MIPSAQREPESGQPTSRESRAAQDVIRAAEGEVSARGPLEYWPRSLSTALTICLAMPEACCLAWGPSRVQLYNERYQALCGPRHPRMWAQDFAAGWPDLWPVLQIPFERAAGGEAAVADSQAVIHLLDGPARPVVLGFSFVPVRDAHGYVAGVLIFVKDRAAEFELERAHKDLDAFTYALGHDLRAPLKMMEEMARLVRSDNASQPGAESAVFLDHLTNGAAKLGGRMDGMLRFAKVSRQPLAFHAVDVAALVEGIVQELRKGATDRHIDIIVGDLPAASGDPQLLRHVFHCILSNALKFTRAAARARIEISARGDPLLNLYSVSDNGAGFNPKYAGKLFGLFRRLHGEAEFEGAGVELAIAHRIVERHGGRLWAEAEPGKGATFQWTLPAASAGRL